MESVSLKLDSAMSKQIERDMKDFKYSTKTEFIREAIRDKLSELSEKRKKDEAWEKLFAMRGALKGKGRFKTFEEWHDWRSGEGSKQLMEYFDKKFASNQK